MWVSEDITTLTSSSKDVRSPIDAPWVRAIRFFTITAVLALYNDKKQSAVKRVVCQNKRTPYETVQEYQNSATDPFFRFHYQISQCSRSCWGFSFPVTVVNVESEERETHETKNMTLCFGYKPAIFWTRQTLSLPSIWRHWVQIQPFVRLHHCITDNSITWPDQYQHPTHTNDGWLQAKLRSYHEKLDRLIHIGDGLRAEKLAHCWNGFLHLGLEMHIILPTNKKLL